MNFVAQSSHRKGGPSLHFGRPLQSPAKSPRSLHVKRSAEFTGLMNNKYKKNTVPSDANTEKGTGVGVKSRYTTEVKGKGNQHHRSISQQVKSWSEQLVSPYQSTNNFLQVRLQEDTFAWVHQRDVDEVRVHSFDTIKRKLRAQAYTSRGMDYKHLFRVYDVDNDNGLELAEFRHALRVDGKIKGSMKTGLSDSAIERVFKDIDTDNSGTIEYQEFLNWLNSPTERPSSPSSAAYHTCKSTAASSSLSPTANNHTTLTAGKVFNDVKKTETARRYRRSQDLEKQRTHLVEEWWNDLYGSKKTKQTRKKKKKTTNKGTKPSMRRKKSSIEGAKSSDPVFSRLYPFTFSRSAAGSGGVEVGASPHFFSRNRTQRVEEILSKGQPETYDTGLWNTSTLVMRKNEQEKRRFSVIY